MYPPRPKTLVFPIIPSRLCHSLAELPVVFLLNRGGMYRKLHLLRVRRPLKTAGTVPPGERIKAKRRLEDEKMPYRKNRWWVSAQQVRPKQIAHYNPEQESPISGAVVSLKPRGPHHRAARAPFPATR